MENPKVWLRVLFQPYHSLKNLQFQIEKSLQRIAAEETKPMYTNESMIRHKIGPECNGWEKVLESFGFEWKESAVYFPLQDRDGKLAEASAMLLQILGLPQTALIALSKLSKNNSTEEDIISQVVLKVKHLFITQCSRFSFVLIFLNLKYFYVILNVVDHRIR